MYNVHMDIDLNGTSAKYGQPKETWNNLRKTRTAFFDESAIVYHDPDHSDDEERFYFSAIASNSIL